MSHRPTPLIGFSIDRKSNNVPNALQEQRNLIEILLQERQNDNQTPTSGSSRTITTETKTAEAGHTSASEISAQISDSTKDQSPTVTTLSTSSNGSRVVASGHTSDNQPIEIKEYNNLIRDMLHKIDLCKTKLDENRHSRVKHGVLNIHSGEILRFQIEYGSSVHFDQSLFTDVQLQSQSLSQISLTFANEPEPAGSVGSTAGSKFKEQVLPHGSASSSHEPFCTPGQSGVQQSGFLRVLYKYVETHFLFRL